MSDEDEISSTRVLVEPQLFSHGHEFADLRSVLMIGQMEESRLVASVKRYAEESGHDLGKIRIRWSVEVSAYGYEMPEEIKPDEEQVKQAGLDFEREVERARNVWLRSIEQAEAKGVGPIVFDIWAMRQIL